MLRIFLILLTIMSISGCQVIKPQAEKAADMIAKASYVNELVESGAILESLINSALMQEDKEVIEASLKAYNAFTSKWGKLIATNPLEAVTRTSLIISEYNVLRIRYAEIERIVIKNWNSYSPENQYLLMEYRKQAHDLDSLVLSLLSQSKANTALIAIQKIAVVAGQIALKLI